MRYLNKKNIFSKEELDQLNKLEQKSLLGGAYGDIENKNTTAGCRCTYNNNGVITNSNETQTCVCDCI